MEHRSCAGSGHLGARSRCPSAHRDTTTGCCGGFGSIQSLPEGAASSRGGGGCRRGGSIHRGCSFCLCRLSFCSIEAVPEPSGCGGCNGRCGRRRLNSRRFGGIQTLPEAASGGGSLGCILREMCLWGWSWSGGCVWAFGRIWCQWGDGGGGGFRWRRGQWRLNLWRHGGCYYCRCYSGCNNSWGRWLGVSGRGRNDTRRWHSDSSDRLHQQRLQCGFNGSVSRCCISGACRKRGWVQSREDRGARQAIPSVTVASTAALAFALVFSFTGLWNTCNMSSYTDLTGCSAAGRNTNRVKRSEGVGQTEFQPPTLLLVLLLHLAKAKGLHQSAGCDATGVNALWAESTSSDHNQTEKQTRTAFEFVPAVRVAFPSPARAPRPSFPGRLNMPSQAPGQPRRWAHAPHHPTPPLPYLTRTLEWPPRSVLPLRRSPAAPISALCILLTLCMCVRGRMPQ